MQRIPLSCNQYELHVFVWNLTEIAVKQLQTFAKSNPLLYKLINYKTKWGLDLSIDYVDENFVEKDCNIAFNLSKFYFI